MNEILALALAAVTGGLLGAFFYGGLWLTIRRALSSRQAPLWILSSMLLRTTLTVLGFYFISRDHWQRLPASLLGFFAASVAASVWSKPSRRPVRRAEEVTDGAHP
jgi:F1F0 ATPase subunit 2